MFLLLEGGEAGRAKNNREVEERLDKGKKHFTVCRRNWESEREREGEREGEGSEQQQKRD